MANMAVSSANTWYEIGTGGSGGGGEEPMSLFFRQGLLERIRNTYLADVLGCLYGIVSGIQEGMLFPTILAGRCAYFGAGASYTYWQQS